MNEKGRLIWDDCTPTRQRRATTMKDVERDIHLQDFDDINDLLDKLYDLSGIDWDDLNFDTNFTVREKIQDTLEIFNDPSDGSPNILYLSVNGEPLKGTLPYDCLKGLNLESISREALIEKLVVDLLIDLFYEEE